MPFPFVLARVDALHYLFMIPLALLSVFMILLILVQRGRGGGLTGALGGMGGQSAFGTKAGDLFTRITIIVAAIWVLLSMASLKILNQRSAFGGLSPAAKAPAATAPAGGAGGVPVTSPEKKGDADKASEGAKEGATGAEKGTGSTSSEAPSGTAAPAAGTPPASAPATNPESTPGDSAKP
jgi:preprotein translocase subunit SecG